MLRRSTIFSVVALAIAVCCWLAGCGGATTTIVKTTTSSAASRDGSKAGFAEIPTVKCRTVEGVHQPAAQLEPTTLVPVPRSVAKNLAAYRDSAGTMVVAPVGFDCRAGIGVDGSETITTYPKGSTPPVGGKAGTVVDLGMATACQGCIAETICTFFPEAKPAKSYFGGLGELKCPEKPLREKVSYPAPTTALFEDPPERRRQRPWLRGRRSILRRHQLFRADRRPQGQLYPAAGRSGNLPGDRGGDRRLGAPSLLNS